MRTSISIRSHCQINPPSLTSLFFLYDHVLFLFFHPGHPPFGLSSSVNEPRRLPMGPSFSSQWAKRTLTSRNPPFFFHFWEPTSFPISHAFLFSACSCFNYLSPFLVFRSGNCVCAPLFLFPLPQSVFDNSAPCFSLVVPAWLSNYPCFPLFPLTCQSRIFIVFCCRQERKLASVCFFFQLPLSCF